MGCRVQGACLGCEILGVRVWASGFGVGPVRQAESRAWNLYAFPQQPPLGSGRERERERGRERAGASERARAIEREGEREMERESERKREEESAIGREARPSSARTVAKGFRESPIGKPAPESHGSYRNQPQNPTVATPQINQSQNPAATNRATPGNLFRLLDGRPSRCPCVARLEPLYIYWKRCHGSCHNQHCMLTGAEISSGRVFMINTLAQWNSTHVWIIFFIVKQHLVQVGRIDGPTECPS